MADSRPPVCLASRKKEIDPFVQERRQLFLRSFSSSPIRDLISIGSRMRSMNICAVATLRFALKGPLDERAILCVASFKSCETAPAARSRAAS